MILLAGALATMASAMPPSFTTSCRFFISIGVTEVIGSTPSTLTSVELLDKGQHGIDLALQVRHFLVLDRDPRQMRDPPGRGCIDCHI